MKNNKEVVGIDVDSSAAQIEGLNWLAEKKGIGKEINELTRRSMNGEIPVSEVMPRKMAMIAPSRSEIEALSREYLEQVSPDAVAVVNQLQMAGKRVVLITGNFHEAVDPLAQALGLNPEVDVFANNLEFHADGSYKGYRENFNLMHDDGKQQVVAHLRNMYGKVAHIGDSMGDALAGADIFIGYGGAALRAPVLEQSQLYIPGKSLAPVLAVELSRRQLRRVQDKALVERAQSGLLMRASSRR